MTLLVGCDPYIMGCVTLKLTLKLAFKNQMPIFIFWSIVRCPFHLSPYPSSFLTWTFNIWLLLLLSRFSCVRLCATPWTAAHQALLSLGFSRQEHWSGLPFPSPMHERENWKWSHSVVSDSSRSHGLQSTRHLHPWDFPGKSTGVGCHCLLPSHILN